LKHIAHIRMQDQNQSANAFLSMCRYVGMVKAVLNCDCNNQQTKIYKWNCIGTSLEFKSCAHAVSFNWFGKLGLNRIPTADGVQHVNKA
jgi:hypothetical protein